MQLNIIFWMACFKWCIFNTAGRNILDNLTPFTNYNKIFFKQYTFTFGHVATGTRVYVFEGGAFWKPTIILMLTYIEKLF